ncbi:hypothetical protein BDZ91DRAFT_798210 [Kalaharituber pfeilii]|nr:hypothetical protein BDZ91DRAFT_798210 [Kalaharituber pfeilii]
MNLSGPPLGSRGLFRSPPDFKACQTRVSTVIGISAFIITLLLITLSLRYYVRLKIVKAFGKDDWLILISAVIIWTAAGMGIWAGTLGLGLHNMDLKKENISTLYNIGIALFSLHIFACCFCQFSILAFYLRLSFCRKLRITIYFLSGFIAISAISRVAVGLYRCLPRSRHPRSRKSSCIAAPEMWYAITAISIATDLIVWWLPIPLLWKLNVRGHKRVGVIATLSIGLLACIFSMIKMSVIQDVSSGGDESWHFAMLFVYEQLEAGMGIFCACMPPICPLITSSSCFVNWRIKRSKKSRKQSSNRGETNVDNSSYVKTPRGPAPNVPKFGAIKFGPRGHLDLDIEGLGVLETHRSNEDYSDWKGGERIELAEVEKNSRFNDNTSIVPQPVPAHVYSGYADISDMPYAGPGTTPSPRNSRLGGILTNFSRGGGSESKEALSSHSPSLRGLRTSMSGEVLVSREHHPSAERDVMTLGTTEHTYH